MGEDDRMGENEEYQDSDEDAEEEIDVFDEVVPDHQYLEQNEVNFRENNQSSLEENMMQFIRHTSAKNHVLEESPTLRLIKALHERKLEHVILAIEEGACINFQNLNILVYLGSINTHSRNTGRTGSGNDANICKVDKVSSMADIYRYLISKDPAILTTEGVLSVLKLEDGNLNEEIVRILQANLSPVLFELYRSILGTEATHRAFIEDMSSSYRVKHGRSHITGKWMTIKCHYQEFLNMLSLFDKCGLDFTTRLGQTHNQTSWQYLCRVFILPWFQRNFVNEENRKVPRLSNKDQSIVHAYIKTMIETKNKAGMPGRNAREFTESRDTVSTLITLFMKELFNRRLVTFNQLCIDIVHVSSFLDCILDVESVSIFGLPLNDHNRHVMIQLIVTHFYKFIGELSDDQLVLVANRTVSKIPEIKRKVVEFCLSSIGRSMWYDNQAEVNLSWVISELRDIISTGLKDMRTLRRLNKLNLPENGKGLDDEDIIAGLKRHLKIREKQMKQLKKTPLYEPEVNKYVTNNCGLNVTANNALIVELVLRWKHRSQK